MTTQLQTLRIDEISGVDDPANATPGWLVCKARTDAALAKALDAAVERIAAEIPADFKVERANPSQRRDSVGRFAPHIRGVTDGPSAPAEPVPPPAAEKALGLFRRAQGYRRLW